MNTSKNSIAENNRSDEHARLARHGVISDLAELLKSRHWAQKLELFSPHAARNMLLGNVRSRYRGRGMEFEEVRRYQAGDDIRTIDWKVSARAQGTYTKLFCEERERPCHILVDQRSSLFFGSTKQFKSVLAAKLSSAIAWAGLAAGDRVGGQIISDLGIKEFRALRSKQSVLHFIHGVQHVNSSLAHTTLTTQPQTQKQVSLANTLVECRRITRPGSAIFIISDFHDFDDSAAKALSKLSKHADITLMHIRDPLEDNLDVSGTLAVSNGTSNNSIAISNSLRSEYQHNVNERMQLFKSAATLSRAKIARFSTKESARQALQAIFRR